MDAKIYGTDIENEIRGLQFNRCVFEKEQASGDDTTVDANGAQYIRCKFKSPASGKHGMFIGAVNPSVYYLCEFDGNGRTYCLRLGGRNGNLFINCTGHNYTTGMIFADDVESVGHFINMAADGVAVSDRVFAKQAAADMRAGLMEGCLSNATGTDKWTDHDDYLDPFIVSGAFNADGNSGDVVSTSDVRWTDRVAARKGMADPRGIRGIIGAEVIDVQTVRGRSRVLNV